MSGGAESSIENNLQAGLAAEKQKRDFGDLESFSKDAFNIAQTRFKYIYTGMRGNNASTLDRFSIRRDTIGSNFSNRLIGSFLYGAADLLYKNNFKLYNKWYNN